ncbi:L,D-transpeptidase family protein [Tepidamorphus sp. 3E244]|uniref:L,D-transpeptidase family protein n=1 Tax=Tepidamorphus sp. 3E244 TaxID=3385498 RepID=UPI0038FCFABC
MKFLQSTAVALCLAALATPCAAMSAEEINSADPLAASGEGPQAGIVRLQVALDRTGASTGWIDGHNGPSTERAIRAAEEMLGLPVDGQLDPELWTILQTGQPAMQTYTLTAEDVNQTLVPDFERGDWETMRGLNCICYHTLTEAFAEKFHMDEELLKALNPGVDFSVAGTNILVAAPGEDKDTPVARVLVDKAEGQVRGFDEGGKLVWAARAAVGSESTPSPSGTVEVTAVALDPTYTYNPENFPENNIKDTFNVAAGPNGPVGSVWIDLSKPTYGLHGTPHPEELNTMASHGCVRMTNWDAKELAHLVTAGVPVEFVE